METKSAVSTGVVHGRFQPPHNGHIRYLLAALERADHLFIGICTPKICTEEEARRTGFPCTAALNPFTYEERAGMIDAALAAAGIPQERYSFVDFPSDYSGMEAVVPKDAVFLMSVTNPSDKEKISYIENQGFRTQTVFVLKDNEERKERSGLVREHASANRQTWEQLVPPAIRDYLYTHGLVEKLKGGPRSDLWEKEY